jgi:hypothetical protein
MLPMNATHQVAVLSSIGDEAVNLNDLESRLPIPRPALIAATGRLVIRGLLEREEEGVFRRSPEGLRVLRDGLKIGGDSAKRRKEPVYSNSLRQRAWAAMRLTKRFTVGSLTELAVKNEKDGEDSIRRFCLALTQAGYLAELPTRQRGTVAGSNGFKQWRLIRDTGEHAPRYMQRDKAFADRNTREVFPCR